MTICRIDRQIDLLLQQERDASFVDTMFALANASEPEGVASGASEAWETAVQARLQQRLVRRMQSVLDQRRDPVASTPGKAA